MKKTEMLKKNYEFKKVLTKGKFYTKNIIEIVILKNNKKANLLGIAIGTKNGKAFQRNRAKRLIRESYARLENQLLDGYSLVVLLRKNFDINKLTFNGVFEEMRDIFEDAKILKEEEDLWKKYVYI